MSFESDGRVVQPDDAASRSATETAIGKLSGVMPVGAVSRARGALASQRLPLLLLVFVGGVVSLGIEVCGPRLMAPYFGTSLIIWANQIGFTLLYLSIGYFIGGRVADKYPSARVLCTITSIAAVATGLIPIVSHPVLEQAVTGLHIAVTEDVGEGAGIFVRSLLVVNLLFSVPTILLGMVSPFAIRLFVDKVGNAGRSAGSLYALSTFGSILGAFLPVLLLMPAWGVRRTLFALCVVLLLASLWGLPLPWRAGTAVPAVILLVPLLLPQVAPLPPLRPPANGTKLLFEQESLYNYIQVVQGSDGTNSLILNEGAGAVHSVYNPDHVLFGPDYYADYLLTAPYFNAAPNAGKVNRLAIIGLAGGTIARQYTAAYGPIPIDGVEIDPALVKVGRRYFGMTEPNLHVYVEDGRTFMRTTTQMYDVVAVDAFQQPYMPFQLTTTEFFQEIRAHLSPTGVVMIKTGHTCTDHRLEQAFVNTLSQRGLFSSVYIFDTLNGMGTDSMIVATVQPTSVDTFRTNLGNLPADSLVSQVASYAAPEVHAATPQRGGTVFTDDQAPVEQLTDQLILSYGQSCNKG
jgi:spermidine synthase